MAPLVAVRTHSVNAVPIAGPMSYMIRDYSSVNVAFNKEVETKGER